MAKVQLQKSSISPRRILAFFAACIVVFFLTLSVVSIVSKYVRIHREVKGIKETQRNLESKEQQLKEKNAFLQTEEGQEYAMRDAFNVVKPGEGVVVVIPEGGASVVGRRQPVPPHVSWWEVLLRGVGIHKQ